MNQDIKKEVVAISDALAKSFSKKESLESFSELIKGMGPEAAKSAFEALSDSEKEVFTKSLTAITEEKLAKAANMDSAAQAKTGAEPKQIASEGIKAESDEDKKKDKAEGIVKESNSKVSPQGDNSELPGQIIKGAELKEESSDKELEKGAFKELAIESLEKGELLGKMVAKMRKRGMDHDICMAALKKKGYDTEMAKTKWSDMQKMDDEMAKEEAKSPVKEEVSKEEAKSPVKEEVQKSVTWASENERLEVSYKRGQNAHYAVDSFIVKSALDAASNNEEVLEKSEKEFDPNNINDLIEKGYDMGSDERERKLQLLNKSQGGFSMKSYSEAELAKSHGMTVEEMRAILGEPELKKGNPAPGHEGDRGGKVIGRTRSGKAIYATLKHEAHKEYTPEDHYDAYSAHAHHASIGEQSTMQRLSQGAHLDKLFAETAPPNKDSNQPLHPARQSYELNGGDKRMDDHIKAGKQRWQAHLDHLEAQKKGKKEG